MWLNVQPIVDEDRGAGMLVEVGKQKDRCTCGRSGVPVLRPTPQVTKSSTTEYGPDGVFSPRIKK